MQSTIISKYFGAGKSAITSPAATEMCPLGNSLHPDIEKKIKFLYGVD